MNPDIIIVGSGPAGVSAALYTARAGLPTCILSQGQGALATAAEVENFYGFPQPISGPDLLAKGIAQARRLGVECVTAEAVSLSEDDSGFVVETAEAGAHHAKVVILATGASHTKPKWTGLADFEGKGVSYCAVCDGFFYRGKDVAVAGNGPYALHEAQVLLPLAKSVTLCTDTKPVSGELPPGLQLRETPVKALEGGQALERLCFADGSQLECSGLFVAIGTAGSTDLAQKIGAVLQEQGKSIAVDAQMRTNVPGLLAAGDCTGGMKQIAKAVYEGAAAGTEAIRHLRGQRGQK